MKPFKFDEFKILTPEEQEKWVEKQTEKVIQRLPTLKKELAVFDDRSDELYNLSGEEIRLMSKVYSNLLHTSIDIDVGTFVQELSTYGDTPVGELVEVATQKRIDSFLENIRATAGEEEKDYAMELLSKLTKEQLIAFTKSKYFFDNGNLNSVSFVKFLTENGVSVGTAKLESFMVSRGIEITDTKYYVDGETRKKLGRPRKKRGRKRKG